MAQLVGSACVRCGQRIGSELDAAFCSTCGQPSHAACHHPTDAQVESPCPACGAPYGPEARSRREAALAEEARDATPQPLDLVGKAKEVGRLYKFGNAYLLPAVLLVALGVAMVAAPDFRDERNRISFADVVRGGVLVLAGITFGLLGWWSYRNAKRAGASRPPRNESN
jgi:hypothetical protein